MTDTNVICPSCRAANDSNSAYCVACGVALPPGLQTQGYGALPPPVPPAAEPPRDTRPSFVLNEHPASITQRGVIASLFDLTFTSLVATKLVRLLYLLAMIWIGLTAAFYILVAFHFSPGAGLVVLFIFAPIGSLFALGCIRIALELCIALFQIMANSHELVGQGRRGTSS
jgi:hypothetical protein